MLAAVLLTAVALAVIPADFRVEARGELQPVRVRDVFAPADGVVGDLRVRHRQQVAADEVLAVLRRSELDLQFKQVWGELQTARKRFASVEAERMQNQRETAEQRQRYGQLTAEQEELREQVAGLEAQHAILQQQQAELEVRSPLAGEVLTWNSRIAAAGPAGHPRADPADRRRSGRSLAAGAARSRPPRCARAGRAAPFGRRPAGLVPAGQRSGHDTPRHAGGRGAADRDRRARRGLCAGHRGPRPRAGPAADPRRGVLAKIDCGRRPLGYVWFHDLLDAVQSWLLF